MLTWMYNKQMENWGSLIRFHHCDLDWKCVPFDLVNSCAGGCISESK
uniref:Uncharacterized protein n=1 Tax=Arundo donax TaxID=35708 RepID=A0A0A9DLG7_ARUDO